jgi:hypothetical protein
LVGVGSEFSAFVIFLQHDGMIIAKTRISAGKMNVFFMMLLKVDFQIIRNVSESIVSERKIDPGTGANIVKNR